MKYRSGGENRRRCGGGFGVAWEMTVLELSPSTDPEHVATRRRRAHIPPSRTSSVALAGGAGAAPGDGAQGRVADDVGVVQPRIVAPRSHPSVEQGEAASRAGARRERRGDHLVPHLIVAGASHAGARSFAAALARHPEVALPARPRIDHYTPLRFGHEPSATLQDYDLDFGRWHGERCRVEVSPVYLDGGRALAERIDRDLPGVRILVLLRDPSERLWSAYLDKCATGRLSASTSYEMYVERCLALRRNGTDLFEANRYYRTLSGGVYLDHLQTWWAIFGDRLRVVPAVAGRGSQQRVVSEVLSWLDLDPAALATLERSRRDGTFVEVSQFRSRWLESFESEPAQHTAPRQRPLWGGSRTLASMARPSRGVRRTVQEFYRPGNQRLALALAERGYRDLPAWLTTA